MCDQEEQGQGFWLIQKFARPIWDIELVMSLGINDIFAGCVCFDGLTDEHQKCFEPALKHFSWKKNYRQISCFKSAYLCLYTTNSNIDHFKKDTKSSFAVGYVSGLSNFVSGKKQISKYLLESDLFAAKTFSEFTESRFSALVMDSERKEVSFHCDFFGKRRLFFKVIGNTLYFSSECRSLAFIPDPSEQIDFQTIRDLFVVSFSMGERTLLKNIRALPQSHFAKWNSKELNISPLDQTQTDDFAVKELTPETYYEEMRRAIHVVVEDTGIRTANITGGSDTRLIYSMLEKKWGFEFRFDPRSFRKDAKTFYDYHVVEILTKKFDLNAAYICDFTSYSRPSADYNILNENRNSIFDIHNTMLTGMMGGEALGGAADYIFETMINLETASLHEREITHLLSPTVLKQTRPSMEDFISLKAANSFKDKDYFFNLTHFYGPSFSFHYDAVPVWFETSQLTSRKITPFLFDSVLRLFNRPGISKAIYGYRFYASIYQKCAKELWDIPFNSPIASWTFGAGNGNDVKGVEKIKMDAPKGESSRFSFVPKSRILSELIVSDNLTLYDDLTLKKLFLIDTWLEGTVVDK